MTKTTRTNRRTLRNAAAKGRLYVKCSFSYTDDYAFDAATGFGKMAHFVQGRLRTDCTEAEAVRDQINAHYRDGGEWTEDIEKLQEEARRLEREHRWAEERAHPGAVWFTEQDFRYKSGHMRGDKQSGYFNIHRNLSYEYKILAEEPVELALAD